MRELCRLSKAAWTVVLASAFALGLVVAVSGPVQAEGSGNNIVGSPHDFSDNFSNEIGDLTGFSDESWNFRNEICRVCHAPHDKNRDTATGVFATGTGLLWNHQLSTQTYTLYTSNTLDGTIGQPEGISKLCLGCHDGTVGIDQFDSEIENLAIADIFIGDLKADFRIPNIPGAEGTDLRATHPISIVYDTADTGLNDPTAATYAFSGTTVASVLENGKVQCSSCHDVHDGLGEAVPETHLLREPNTVAAGGTASGLCLTCHKK